MEIRLRLTDREIVLVGRAGAAKLDIFEEGDERRLLGSLSLARPSELEPLFEELSGATAPPSDAGPSKPFQPPPGENA